MVQPTGIIHGKIVEVAISPELVEKVKKAHAERGLLKGNIMGEESSLVGLLAEHIFAAVWGEKLTPSSGAEIYDYDFLRPNGEKVEIKARKCRTVPHLDCDCSLYDYNIRKQRCDTYVFIRVHEDLKKAWILGSISKEKFLKLAVEKKAGFVSPGQYSGGQQVRYKKDSWDILVRQLD